MNPLLPNKYHIPDVEARQWSDGRMYLYGSYDISGDSMYCSFKYHVFSSDDLVNWVDHGESLSSIGGELHKDLLFAPDCIYKDGRYYLYFCMAGAYEGVAESSEPYGPFKGVREIPIASRDAIDPSAFVDDDGKVYYFWGQFNLKGGMLADDMVTLLPETINTNMLNEKDHGFHEGSSIRKRNGIYYMVFADTSRGKATSLGYATATHPLGPYTKRGIIIDNDGCDKETWNNHGSIAEFNGKWYVFYHRSSQGSRFSRRVCIEPIEFLEDGSIPEVEMTTQGITGPLLATEWIDAWRACLQNGKVRTQQLDIGGKLSEYLGDIYSSDWVCYKYVDFGDGVDNIELEVASLSIGGAVNIHIDSPDGEMLTECQVTGTGGWHNWQVQSFKIQPIKGVHALYLRFAGWPGTLFNLRKFKFSKTK